MNTLITVTPAYGRDYKTSKAARIDWHAGLNFILQDYTSQWDGKPINKPQADEAGLVVTLRFDRIRKTCQAEK